MLLPSLSIPEFGPNFCVTFLNSLGVIVDVLGFSGGNSCFFLMKSMVCLCEVVGFNEDNSSASCCCFLGLSLSLVCFKEAVDDTDVGLRNLCLMLVD